MPLRARGRVLGALLVESKHDQHFGYDDEDALMLLCGQFAVAMSLMQPPEPEPPPRAAKRPPPRPDAARPAAASCGDIARDNSVFLDDVYLIRGVAGAILWKLRDANSCAAAGANSRTANCGWRPSCDCPTCRTTSRCA